VADFTVKLSITADGTVAVNAVNEVSQATAKMAGSAVQSGRQAAQSFEVSGKAAANMAAEVARAQNAALALLKSFGGAVVITRVTRAFIDAADAAGQLRARMQFATEGAEDYRQAQARIEQVARSSYQSIEAISEVFIRSAEPMRQLGMATSDTLDLTEALSLGLVVSGANAQSQGRLAALGKNGPDPTPGPGAGDPPPEWAYHPGKAARSMPAAEAFGRKVMALPAQWRKIALDDAQRRSVEWFADWPARLQEINRVLHPQGASPVGFMTAGLIDAAAAEVRRRAIVPGLAPQSALIAVADRQLAHALHDLPARDRELVARVLEELPEVIAAPDRVYRQVAPDRLVYTRALPDGRHVAVYVRIDGLPARPGRNRVQSNWFATAEIRTEAQMADYVRLR